MTRTLTITATEWASVQDGTLWLVREGEEDDRCWHGGANQHAPTCARGALPPAEFVQACAPCECGGSRCVAPPDCDCDRVTSLNYALCTHPPADCPDCFAAGAGAVTAGRSAKMWSTVGVR